jgi:hypothetical protein
VALDGANGHSPFTEALANRISEPGLPIEVLFRQVRIDVLLETDGFQTPWDTSSLTAEFVFSRAQRMTAEEQAEQQLWDTINQTRDPVQIVLFLRTYGDGRFANDARALLSEVLLLDSGNAPPPAPVPVTELPADPEPVNPREQALFDKAQQLGRLEDYEAYIAAFPDGIHAALVGAEIAALRAARASEAPVAPPPAIPELVEAPAALPPETQATGPTGAENGPITFFSPLDLEGSPYQGLSISDLLQGVPEYPPIEGLPDEIWQGKECASCHQWTPEQLCTQALTYSAADTRSLRTLHPYGGFFKGALRRWADDGCR